MNFNDSLKRVSLSLTSVGLCVVMISLSLKFGLHYRVEILLLEMLEILELCWVQETKLIL